MIRRPEAGKQCRRAGSLVYMSCHDEVHEEVTKNPIMHSKSEKRARARTFAIKKLHSRDSRY